MSIMAACHIDECSKECLKIFLQCLLSSLIMRYLEQFKHWKQMYWDKSPYGDCEENCGCEKCTKYHKDVQKYNTSAYDMAWLRYVETIAESAPQWCLQVGIMFVQWNFPWLTIISSFFSFFSLALSITTLEKTRATKNGHDFKFFPHTVVFFFCQVFTLLSRLSTIVIIAYRWPEYFYIFAISHWYILNFISLCGMNASWYIWLLIFALPFLNIFTFPFFFHPTEAYHHWLTKGTKCVQSSDNDSCFPLQYWALFGLISLEDIVLTPIAVFVQASDVPHINVMMPTGMTLVITGLLAGVILSVLYYNEYYTPPPPEEQWHSQP